MLVVLFSFRRFPRGLASSFNGFSSILVTAGCTAVRPFWPIHPFGLSAGRRGIFQVPNGIWNALFHNHWHKPIGWLKNCACQSPALLSRPLVFLPLFGGRIPLPALFWTHLLLLMVCFIKYCVLHCNHTTFRELVNAVTCYPTSSPLYSGDRHVFHTNDPVCVSSIPLGITHICSPQERHRTLVLAQNDRPLAWSHFTQVFGSSSIGICSCAPFTMQQVFYVQWISQDDHHNRPDSNSTFP